MKIKGKNILITGGAKGIGFSTAKYLLSCGANIGITDIDEESLNKAIKELGDNFWWQISDVSKIDQCKTTVEDFCNNFGTIDVLINNAAIIYNGPLISIFGGLKLHDPEIWSKIIDTNLNGAFYLTSFCVEQMLKKRTSGLIINLSSICANGNPGQSAYSASKAALEAATKSWAKELGGFNLRFACIAPGFTETDTTLNIISESVRKDIQNRIPLKRLAQIDEIVNGIVFIIQNNYFNGKVLSLDGGVVL